MPASPPPERSGTILETDEEIRQMLKAAAGARPDRHRPLLGRIGPRCGRRLPSWP